MQTIQITTETNRKSNFNMFMVKFTKNIKSFARKVGKEMQKHADEAGQAMRS